jgi:hypothetical protein
MVRWVPETTKTDDLPTLTYKTRKPVPLGAMFHNGFDVTTGVIVYQSVVQHVEVVMGLEYFGTSSS